MANPFQTIHGAIEWVLEKLEEFEKDHSNLVAQNEILERTVKDFERDRARLVEEDLNRDRRGLAAQHEILRKKVDELEQTKTCLEEKVSSLQEKNEEFKKFIEGSETLEFTHRNILYNEERNRKRLPVLRAPVRGADQVGSLDFGECFAASGQQAEGQDVWLQIRAGNYADQWVLGCDAGRVNCVDMTNFGLEKYRGRIQSSAYHGQHFPQKMLSKGFAGSSNSNICLISASGDGFWRELNIEMLHRGIATATAFEKDWGGAEAFNDWVAHYAANCVQYGQLRTPLQKHLMVAVKPTSHWREYQAGSCLGPDLDKMCDDLGKAQYKECCWLKGMKDQLRVKWGDVEFVTAFAFLRTHCAWTRENCREAANHRFVGVLQEFFAGGYNEKALYELERAYWLWDEAFDGCVFNEAARITAYTKLQRWAELGARLEIPVSLRTASAAPLAWELVVGAMTSRCVSAGGEHSLALDATGALCAWGSNDEMQCSAPTLAPDERWVCVSAGYANSLALTAAGKLHSWGSNSDGQCTAPELPDGVWWVAVSAGSFHSLGFTSEGVMHAWGSNSHGQCTVPALPVGDRWAMVSAGLHHSLGLTVAGVLYARGDDKWGQCSHAPRLPQGERWAAISAGGLHSLGLTAEGKLHAWGADHHQQCSGVPTLALGERWASVSAGGEHSLGLTSSGTLHAWGRDLCRQCSVPVGEHWLSASAGYGHSLGLTSDGAVHAWGHDGDGQVSCTPESLAAGVVWQA